MVTKSLERSLNSFILLYVMVRSVWSQHSKHQMIRQRARKEVSECDKMCYITLFVNISAWVTLDRFLFVMMVVQWRRRWRWQLRWFSIVSPVVAEICVFKLKKKKKRCSAKCKDFGFWKLQTESWAPVHTRRPFPARQTHSAKTPLTSIR